MAEDLSDPLDLGVLPDVLLSVTSEEELRIASEEAVEPFPPEPSDTTDETVPIGRGWAFDFGAGDFVRQGAAPARVYEEDHLRVWIEKTLYTARYAHAAYSGRYGMETPFADFIGLGMADAAHYPALAESIKGALLAHDRIVGVDNFQYEYDGNAALFVTFTVHLDNQTAFEMTATA